jgi:hypothetical protein
MGMRVDKGCVLLFSGGRDSTLAALRLAEQGWSITLLTLTSPHLVGIESVRTRVKELTDLLGPSTEWVHVAVSPRPDRISLNELQTCLPCHHAYLSVAVSLADHKLVHAVATGYSGYQAHWLEQTPYAIERLREVLGGHGKELLLPVGDLISKDQAIRELQERGVSDCALEQKCLQQQTNAHGASQAQQNAQIDRWAAELDDTLRATAGLSFEAVTPSYRSEILSR